MAAPIEVQITSTGVDGVQRSLRLVRNEAQSLNEVTKEGEAISHSAARGLGELGRGLGNVAQSGELGAFALREFTGAAFRLGAEVGSAGLGAAIGLSVLAIGTLVESLSKSGEAAKKAREEFQSYIETLVHGSVVEASLAKAKLYSGDPTAMITGPREGESDIAFHARAGGQQWMESEQARLQKQFDALQAVVRTRPHGEMTHKESSEWDSLVSQLKEINQLLNQNDLNLARISGVYDMLMGKEKELASFQLQLLRAKADAAHVGQVSLPFGETQKGDYFASMERLYRSGLMGDQINNFGFGPKGDKSLFAGGQISGLKIKAAQIPRDMFAEAQGEILKQWDKTQIALAEAISNGITTTFATVVGDAFTGSFKQIGDDALGGLGGILETMGGILIKFGVAMEGLSVALTNPFTSGIAAIGIGVLLEGLGKALESTAHRHSSSSFAGGSGGFSSASAYNTQQSIAGGGQTTIIVPGGKIGWDLNDAEDLDAFNQFLEKVGGNRLGSTNVRVVPA